MPTQSVDADEWGFPNRATPIGSPAYYAVRFSPVEKRNYHAQMLAWYDTIRAICDDPHDSGIARLKLDWWRKEVNDLGTGHAHHPLAVAIQQHGVNTHTVAAMTDIIDAAEQQIQHLVSDDDAFIAACRASGGNLFLLFVDSDQHAGRHQQIVDHGAYREAIERIRWLGSRAQRMPPDITPAAMQQWSAAQRSERIDELLRPLRQDARMNFRSPGIARRLFALSAAIHHKMRRKGYPVADKLIDRTPVEHLWTAWRCH